MTGAESDNSVEAMRLELLVKRSAILSVITATLSPVKKSRTHDSFCGKFFRILIPVCQIPWLSVANIPHIVINYLQPPEPHENMPYLSPYHRPVPKNVEEISQKGTNASARLKIPCSTENCIPWALNGTPSKSYVVLFAKGDHTHLTPATQPDRSWHCNDEIGNVHVKI